MKKGVTLTPLLFLLASSAMSAVAPGSGNSVTPLYAFAVGHAPQLAVRAPKRGSHSGGHSGGHSSGHSGGHIGGSDDDDDDDDDSSNFDFDDDSGFGGGSGGSSGSGSGGVDVCTNGSSCSSCFGPGYIPCKNTDRACYNPSIPGDKDFCDRAPKDFSAGANLNSQNSFMAGAAVALGMTAAML